MVREGWEGWKWRRVGKGKGLVRGKRLEETGVGGRKKNGREGEGNLYIEIEILR